MFYFNILLCSYSKDFPVLFLPFSLLSAFIYWTLTSVRQCAKLQCCRNKDVLATIPSLKFTMSLPERTYHSCWSLPQSKTSACNMRDADSASSAFSQGWPCAQFSWKLLQVQEGSQAPEYLTLPRAWNSSLHLFTLPKNARNSKSLGCWMPGIYNGRLISSKMLLSS